VSDEPKEKEVNDGATADQKSGLIDERTRELLKASMDPDKLCMMPNSYQPWL